MSLFEWMPPAIVAAVGQSLLHFLWQGALLAALLVLAQWISRPASPRTRYAMDAVTLLLMALAPLMTLFWLWPVATEAEPAISRFTGLVWWPSLSSEPASSASPDWTPWLVALWLSGVAALASRNALAYAIAWSRARRCRMALPAPWPGVVAKLSAQLGISRTVRAFTADRWKIPSVFGQWRPVIIIPAAALLRLTPQELEAILAHELAHVSRHDWIVNILQTIVETVLFYHPAVWWVSTRIRKEREFCCDDIAAGLAQDRGHLARALVTLEESRWTPVLAASASPLRIRIERLLGVQNQQQPSQSRLAALALLAIIFSAALWRPVVAAQQPPEPPPPPPAPAAKPVNKKPPKPPAPPPPPPASTENARPAIAPVPPTPPSPPAEVIVGVPGGVEGGVPGGVPGGVVAVVAGGVQGALVTPRSDGEKSEAEKLVDEEIARRIRYANERFSKPGAPGSQSDRGRIYLLWGPPDELEVHPGTKEAWLYHQLAAYGKNAIFEFDGAGKLTKAPTRPAAK